MAAAGSSARTRSAVSGAQGGQVEAAALRLVGSEPRVAARAGEDGQPAVAARARAADRERLGQLEQLVHVVRPGGAGLLHQRAEGGVVAGHRAGVRRGRARPGGRGPDLEHRDADAGVGAQRERLAQPRAVAVALQEEGDRAHALALGEGVQPVAGVDDGLVAARDHGVQAQAAARGQRVDRDVAALRDDGDVAGLAGHERVAPQRRAVVEGDDPVAVGPAHRQVVAVGRGAQGGLQALAVGRLAEARRVDDGAAAPARAGLLDHLGHARRGDGDDDRVDGLGQVGHGRHAGAPVHAPARRVHAPHAPAEAGAPEVAQRLVGVGAGPAGGADDGDRARREQWRQIPQCSTRSTPRRSRARATIRRWISLVPSQMRSTRSSRHRRSATFVRM